MVAVGKMTKARILESERVSNSIQATHTYLKRIDNQDQGLPHQFESCNC